MVSPIGDGLPFEMIELLRQISTELVNARLDLSANGPSPAQLITKAAPLVRARPTRSNVRAATHLCSPISQFASLNGVNRSALISAAGCKARTQEARLEMDSAHLRLQVSFSSL